MMPGAEWSRRNALVGGALLALALCMPGQAASEPVAKPDARQREILRAVCDLTIPDTKTPGALACHVDAFVILALDHGLEGARGPVDVKAMPELAAHLKPDGSLDHLAWMQAELDRRRDGNWLGAEIKARLATLTAIDDEAYPAGPPLSLPSPWRTLKSLILTGYYTSEVGGSQELTFNLVPGRFDPDLPLDPLAPACSSDWNAVDFS